jgi:hypothetical protein
VGKVSSLTQALHQRPEAEFGGRGPRHGRCIVS